MSLNPSKVEAVTTTVGNSFHRRIADGKNDCFQDIFLFLVDFYIYIYMAIKILLAFAKGKNGLLDFIIFP